MKIRIARHARSLGPIVDFYVGTLGLEILGEFKNHQQYDGVFLGHKNSEWHLEFTVSNEMPDHKADEDDLLVFYVATIAEYNRLKDKFRANKIEEVAPKNPYWKKNGVSFSDPEGFRIVITLQNPQKAAWNS